MIEVSRLHKKFGKTAALNGVNLSFAKGECVALIGPNACGKTTLIKSILGMVIPDSGTVLFDGQNIEQSPAYRSRIGYMPQVGRYPDNMTVEQVINTIKSIRNYTGTPDEDLPQRFRLAEHYSKQMRTLSGGTTQKVSATLAFLFNPDVLILDEPTAGLDPLASEILKDKIIAERQKGKLILITSHLLNELNDMISLVVFMEEGSVRFEKTIDTLQEETGENRISKAIAAILKRGNGTHR